MVRTCARRIIFGMVIWGLVGAQFAVADTAEFSLSDSELIQLAADLSNDPEEIYAFVRDEVSYEAYQGSLRGARGTLWSKAGNSIDQASLLVALLRISGFDAQYVEGQISDADAGVLIGSMFTPQHRILGCMADDVAVADPISDPLLIADARRHFWVQLDDGGITNLDPSFPNAIPGQSFTTVGNSYVALPESIQHRVQISLSSEFTTLWDNTVGANTDVVLEQKFAAAELVGKNLSFGHFTQSTSGGGLVFSSFTHTYSPFVIIGERDDDIADDILIRGTDYQETASNFAGGLGNQTLTGVFLEVALTSPDGTIETFERPLLDRVGFSARQGGGAAALGAIDPTLPAVLPMDITTLQIGGSHVPGQSLELFQDRLQSAADRLIPFASAFEAFAADGPQTDEEIETFESAVIPMNLDMAVQNELALSYLATSSDRSGQALSGSYLVKSYFDSPRVLIAQSGMNLDSYTQRLDIRRNVKRTLAFPQQAIEQAANYEIARGLLESSIEGEVLRDLSANQLSVRTAFDTINEADGDQSLVYISGRTAFQLDALTLSDEANTRITQALNNNKSVIVPSSMVVDDQGFERIAWFEVDDVTGHTIAVAEDGGHQAIAYISAFKMGLRIFREGYNGNLAGGVATAGAKYGSGKLVGLTNGNIGFLIGFSTSSLPFIAGFLEGINNGDDVTAAISNGKAAVDKYKEEAVTTCEILDLVADIAAGSLVAPNPVNCESFENGVDLFKDYAKARLGDPPLPPYLIAQQFPALADVAIDANPGFTAEIIPDETYTLTVDGQQLPLVYRARIANSGPQVEQFALNVVTPTPKYIYKTSVDQITLQPGQVGEIGICAFPNAGELDSPGSMVPLTAEVVPQSMPAGAQAISTTVVTPEYTAIELEFAKPILTTQVNIPAQIGLRISSVGNAEAVNLPIEAIVPDGLTLSGLPVSVSIPAGQTNDVMLTVTSNDSALNKKLLIDLNIEFGLDLDGSPFTENAQLSVDTRSMVTEPIVNFAIAINAAGNAQLGTVLLNLADDLSALEQDPQPTTCAAIQNDLQNLQLLGTVNPFITSLGDQITSLTSLANACDIDQLLAAVKQFFIDDFNLEFVLASPSIEMNPGRLDLTPGLSGNYDVLVSNPSRLAITVNLAASTDATEAVLTLSSSQVSLAAGESQTVSLQLDQTYTTTTVETVQVTGTLENHALSLSDSAQLLVRAALVDVVTVTADPSVVEEGGSQTNLSVLVNNSANTERQIQLQASVLDSANNVLLTPPATVVTLQPSTELTDVDLGSLPVDSLANGNYRVRVDAQSVGGGVLAGRSATGVFYKGAIIEATVSADPIIVVPGTSEVRSVVQVNNLSALTGVDDSANRWIEYHTPVAIVPELSNLVNAVGDPQTVLGLPDGDFLSLNGGTLVLDLGESEQNRVIDGPKEDLWFSEAGNNEAYDVELSSDGVTFTATARLTGTRGLDIGAFGLNDIRYVKIIDRGRQSGATPGSDIIGVRVLNSQGGVKVERAVFSVGIENRISSFGNAGIINTPIVANIDSDPLPEIMLASRDASGIGAAFFVIDAETGALDLTLTDRINLTHSVAVGEVLASNPGPEIAVSTSHGRLRLLSSDGTILWEVVGGNASPVIANVDEDPEPEIIAAGTRSRLTAFNGDGSIAWSTLDTIDTGRATALVVSDIDGDGIGEVISNFSNGAVGVTKAPVVSGATARGQVLWGFDVGSVFGGPAVADVTGNGLPEVIVGDNSGRMNIFDAASGTLIKRITFIGTNISPPVVADINADGLTDILFAAAGSQELFAISLDADVLVNPEVVIPIDDVLLWKVSALDRTASGSGLSIYDLDGDGIWEVIWNGFGSSTSRHLNGGLSIFSGLDGKLIYNNPRINSRTLDENPTIADVDGDGFAEVLAVDQEGLWIIGADDLWVSARDIWNQQSYHITNVNDDLTIPSAQPQHWLDHNSFRTQRPPMGVINRLDIGVNHQLNSSEFVANLVSVDPQPSNTSATAIDWQVVRRFGDAQNFFEVSGQVNDVMAGEQREISTGSTVTARYTDENGQVVNSVIVLPSTVVAAPHIIDIEPASQLLEAGQTAEYEIILSNPSAIEQVYQLAASGLNGLSATIIESVTIAAESTTRVTLSVLTPVDRALSQSFSVEAVTSSNGSDVAFAELSTDPDTVLPLPIPDDQVDLEDLGVSIEIIPGTLVIGIGDTAIFQVRVTNTGVVADSYNLSVNLPVNYVGVLSNTRLDLLPGLSHSREITLQVSALTDAVSGSIPFSVQAISQMDSQISDTEIANLDLLGLGVTALFTPNQLTVGSADSVNLSVQNTGAQDDVFDIVLVGPAAQFAELVQESVSIPSGNTVDVSVSLSEFKDVLPGEMILGAIVTSQTDSRVSDTTRTIFEMPEVNAVSLTIDPDEVLFEELGATEVEVDVRNTGNAEDVYTVGISNVSGPLDAKLIDAFAALVDQITEIRILPFASVGIPLYVELLNFETGTVEVRVDSVNHVGSNDSDMAIFGIANVAPVAVAGENSNTGVGGFIQLDGSNSFDLDGDMLRYQWQFVSVPDESDLSDVDLSGASTALPSFRADVVGEFVVQLVVNDGMVDSTPSLVTISAFLENVPPNANAGPEQVSQLNSPVFVDGSASSDPDAGPSDLTYLWTFVSTPVGSTLGDADIGASDSPVAEFTADVVGDYEMQLTVSDGAASDTDQVVISITIENIPPVANAGSDQEAQLNDVVILDGRASSDADNGPQNLSFDWHFISVPKDSALTNADLQINSEPENPMFMIDVPGIYIIGLVVDDGAATDRDAVVVSASCVAGVSLKPGHIWPPNNKLVAVDLDARDRSACIDMQVAANCSISNVQINDHEHSPSCGHCHDDALAAEGSSKSGGNKGQQDRVDWEIVSDRQVLLRAVKPQKALWREYQIETQCIEPDGRIELFQSNIEVSRPQNP